MENIRKTQSLSVVSILVILVCYQNLYARGGAIIFGPDGKIQRPPTEEEYRKFSGENLPRKVGDKWLVPSVVARDYDHNPHYIKLSLLDFWIGKIDRIPSRRPKGEILSQSPKEKSFVAKPSAIDLVISSGPDR